MCNSIPIRKIQNIAVFINNKVAQLSLDSGCEGDCISETECRRLQLPILPLDKSDHKPKQADGQSNLIIIGKTKFYANRGDEKKLNLYFEGYVIKTLQSDILCGASFMERNKIVQELHNKRIIIDGKYYIMETPVLCPNPVPDLQFSNVTVEIKSHSINSDDVTVKLPNNCEPNQTYLIELNGDTTSFKAVKAVGRNIKINLNDVISNFQKSQENVIRVAQITSQQDIVNPKKVSEVNVVPSYIKEIEVNSNIKDTSKARLQKIHKTYESVFDGDLSEGYNGYSGNHDVDFNFTNGIPPPVHIGCVPSYNKKEDNLLMQAMIDRLEEKNIVAKASDLNIIPRFASPAMLVLKQAARNIDKDVYESFSIQRKLDFNRLVLCQNKLNEYVEKIPHKYNTVEDTISIVSSFEFVITTDLTDSFWQRKIKRNKLPYFAFHSPYKGTYIFLRSSQGFLNQSEGLETMISCILEEFIAQGWCRIHADNIYVLGHEEDETISRWQKVLHELSLNNIKLSSRKTAAFPERLDLLGWIKEGKFLIPDPHRQNCISKFPLPTTLKQLRSYIGSYRQFLKCQSNMSGNLQQLEDFIGKYKNSSDQLNWSPDLEKCFYESRDKIKQLDRLYIPKPQDQLVITSDWSKKGFHATLWAAVEGKFLVVARMSGKPWASVDNMQPCDGEVKTVFLAGKYPLFRSYIQASSKKTICLLDNKTGVQAANLLRKGKFSTSKVINELLSGIAELNLEFQHMSGKLGQNFIDDFGSRNPSMCEGEEHCKICFFLSNCKDMHTTIGTVVKMQATPTSIVGTVEINNFEDSSKLVNEIIRGTRPMPFSNRKAMRVLQDNDKDLQLVKEYLLSAKRPQASNSKINTVKRFLQNNISIAKDGCIVVLKIDKKLQKKELLVVPDQISLGLMYSLHLKLNHPSPYQLSKLLETRFYILDRDKKANKVWKECTPCQSIATIPKEIKDFKPNEVPTHPGQSFTVDVMKTNKKVILIGVENFSGFVVSTIIPSESKQDLVDGIIAMIPPFMSPHQSTVRVDQAPGFKSILKNRSVDLTDIGIILEGGDVKNKNSLAVVDRKIQELQKEIKLCAPADNVINTKVLSKATTALNSKIRGCGLSSREILFSRDQFDSSNLQLDDSNISELISKKRALGNKYSAISKAQVKRKETPAGAVKGNLVFLKNEGGKLSKRELYLVMMTDEKNNLFVCKVPHLLSSSKPTIIKPQLLYKVKDTDVYLAPNQPLITSSDFIDDDFFDFDCEEFTEKENITQTTTKFDHDSDTDDTDDTTDDEIQEVEDNAVPTIQSPFSITRDDNPTLNIEQDNDAPEFNLDYEHALFSTDTLKSPEQDHSKESDSSLESMEWDPYIHPLVDTTPDQEVSPRDIRRTFRECAKIASEIEKSTSVEDNTYNLRPRRSLKAPILNDYVTNVDDLQLSTDSEGEVFELNQPAPKKKYRTKVFTRKRSLLRFPPTPKLTTPLLPDQVVCNAKQNVSHALNQLHGGTSDV